MCTAEQKSDVQGITRDKEEEGKTCLALLQASDGTTVSLLTINMVNKQTAK